MPGWRIFKNDNKVTLPTATSLQEDKTNTVWSEFKR